MRAAPGPQPKTARQRIVRCVGDLLAPLLIAACGAAGGILLGHTITALLR